MNMKKSTLAAAMLLSFAAASTSAQALTVSMTTMEFYDADGNPGFFGGGLNTSVNGTMNSDGTGSGDDGGTKFFGTPWTVTQAFWQDTAATGNWSGSTASGPFSYDFHMTGNQVAAGMLFNWGAAVDIAVLQIWDCTTVAGVCTGVNNDAKHPGVPGTEMANGPFAGQHATFKGTTTDAMPATVPVPAAVWLFGSGLLGLVGVARRKIQA